jgi:recombinational DNA repair ATPase RecF
VYDGDGDNGLEIYFENEQNRRAYLDMELEDIKILMGDDSEDYVAHG